MKVSKKINPYSIEIEFKDALLTKCDIVLKEYAKTKLLSLKSKPSNVNKRMLTQFCERFIAKNSLDVEYAIIISLIFCNEFMVIKEQVEMGIIDFHHFKDPDFWNNSPSYKPHSLGTNELKAAQFDTNITIRDAIFFSYTTLDNFYPQTREVVADMLDFSEKHKRFDCYTFFKDITYV